MTTILISLIFVLLILYIVRQVKKYILLNKYKIVLSLLEYFLDQAYTTIYNDHIITYSSSGEGSIPKDEMETIERNFVKLSFSLMGETNEQFLIEFFGTRSTIVNNMLLYVRKQISSDNLSKIIQQRQHESNIL